MKFLAFVYFAFGIIAVYFITSYLTTFSPYSASATGEAGLFLMIAFWPYGMFLGSMLTGFLCGLTVKNILAPFVIAPGFPLSLLFILCHEPLYAFFMYLISLAGIYLGYLLMRLLKKLRLNS